MSELQQGIAIKDRYVLKEYKGSGSFGEVWLAHDQFLEIDVAIKMYISLDIRGIEEFKTEYKTAYGLNHPNLLTTTYFDVWEQRPFLVMKYCSNGSAGSLVGNVSEERVWQFIRDVAAGLAFLHAQQPEPIVHQDIKPDNILIDEQDNFLITDFGISKRIRSTMRKQSKRSATSGAAAYMGPERFSKDPTPIMASDIWSLGASIYELLTGELPFCGMGGGMQMNGAELPELEDNWSSELNDAMQACMAKDTWDRPRAAQLVAYAEAMMNGEKPIALHKKENTTANNDSKNKKTVEIKETPSSQKVGRHGFVSFWLILCLISSSLSSVYYLIGSFNDYSYICSFFVLVSSCSAYGVFLLLKWRRVGFWLWALSLFGATLFFLIVLTANITIASIFACLFMIGGIIGIQFGILRIKKKEVSTWEQLKGTIGMRKERSLLYFLIMVVSISLLSMGGAAYNRSFLLEREVDAADISRYHQLLGECRTLTASGNNSNVEPLIKAKTCMEEIDVLEYRYASSIKDVQADEVRAALHTKLQEAHDAWKRAAQSQYNKAGDADKAIEYYKIALSLKEDDSTRRSLEAIEADQTADWISNDSAVIE